MNSFRVIFFLLVMSYSLADSAHAQSGFREGYIITTDLDTINGFIDFQESSSDYKFCVFKRKNASTKVKYKPGGLVGFKFLDGPLFISQELEIDTKYAAVFMEVLLFGELSLLKSKRQYYVWSSKIGVIELKSEIKAVQKDNHTYQTIDKRFIGILMSLMEDCPEVQSNIPSMSLSETELLKLFEAYHSCRKLEYINYKPSKSAISIKVGVVGGLNISILQFSYPFLGKEYLTEGFGPSYAFLMGVSVDIIFPRVSTGFSLQLDGFYVANKYSANTSLENGSTNTHTEVDIELKQLKLPVGLQYVFRRKSFSPIINGGFSPTINLTSDVAMRQEIETNNVVDTFEGVPFAISKNQLGFYFGIGVEKMMLNESCIQFSVRFELTSGIVDSESAINRTSSGLTSAIFNTNLMLAYVF